jgi:hypothetical protein
LKTSIVRRVERLEEQFEPCDTVELPPLDYDLLIESEKAYFSKELTLLRSKARELGYGDRNNRLNWFDLGGCDPFCNEEVRMECFEVLNDDEVGIVETLREVIEKCIRLTDNLLEEEKAVVKEYNYVAFFLGNGIMMNGVEKGWWKGRTVEELGELRVRYGEIMNKHGEKVYE